MLELARTDRRAPAAALAPAAGPAVSPVLLFSNVDRSEAGGVQRVIHDLARGLRRRGVDLAEVTPGVDEVPGAIACSLHVRPGGRALHAPSLMRLAGVLARVRPRVVNVHFAGAETLYFTRLKPLFRYSLVLSLHGSDLLRPEPSAEARLDAFLSAADLVTVVSTDIEQRVLGSIDPGKVRRIGNGVDCAFWSPGPVSRGGPPRIVAIGRLDPVKDFEGLLAAAARLAADGADFVVEIIGDGPERERLEALAAAPPLRGRVEFPGRLGPEAVRDRLRRAHVFALSSISEGMPLAVLEAMACGVPVVSTDVGGVAEILPPEGRLVPPSDPDALAAALGAALAEPPHPARGEPFRRRAEAHSVERATDAYLAAYAHAVGADNLPKESEQ